MLKIKVEENNIRIDSYLITKTEFSRSKIQKLIKDKLILVNGKSVKNSYLVKENDVILIDDFEDVTNNVQGEDIPLDIVYEDDDIIVVNKKSGMVVHPGNGNYNNTLVNALVHYSDNLSSVNGEFRPGIVHRIDAFTSGLLVVAKNDFAHNYLAQSLKDKKTKRKYLALVEGVINEDTATIDAPIGRDDKDRKKMTVTSHNSKNAVTHIRVLERYKDATLIECSLETGRTHQIRVHMKYINHPIINDKVYGSKSKMINPSFGQMLHAKTLGFVHPRTGEYLEFTCDAPLEFYEILSVYKDHN